MSEASEPHRISLVAADGTPLSIVRTPAAGEPDAAVVLLPGFWRRAESPRMARLAAMLARRWSVLTLDFRGHGASSGRFTFGRLEHHDVDAVLAWAASQGIRRVVLVGASMGGAAVVTTLGRPDATPQPVEVRGAVLVSTPGRFGGIRPQPWRRGSARIPVEDAIAAPRFEWSFPFTAKVVPETCWTSLPPIPVRLIHAKDDWLVSHRLGESLHAQDPSRGEFFLLDLPGAPHADDLMADWETVLLRLVRTFVDACLSGTQPDPEPRVVSGEPWMAALARHVPEGARHAPDLGGLVPRGELRDVIALSAGRDGVHLAFRVGDEACWARGLRDGSVHGLNLLGNALAADGPAWPEATRALLAQHHARLIEQAPSGAASASHVVRPRGAGGFQVEWPETPRRVR